MGVEYRRCDDRNMLADGLLGERQTQIRGGLLGAAVSDMVDTRQEFRCGRGLDEAQVSDSAPREHKGTLGPRFDIMAAPAAQGIIRVKGNSDTGPFELSHVIARGHASDFDLHPRDEGIEEPQHARDGNVELTKHIVVVRNGAGVEQAFHAGEPLEQRDALLVVQLGLLQLQVSGVHGFSPLGLSTVNEVFRKNHGNKRL